MRSTIRTLFLVSAVAAASAAMANPLAAKAPAGGNSANGLQMPSAKAVNFSVEATLYKETYSETADTGAKLMQQKATMKGLRGNASHLLSKESRVKGFIEYARGSSDYVGSYQGGNYGDVTYSGASRDKFVLHGEYQYAPKAMKGLISSVGLEYHRLTDNSQGVTGGYKRINSQWLLTVGAEMQIPLSQNWRVTPSVKYLHMIKGNQYSGIGNGIDHKLNGGKGYELAVTVESASRDGTGVYITPFMRSFNVKASDVVNGFQQPKSKTKEVGINVGWRF